MSEPKKRLQQTSPGLRKSEIKSLESSELIKIVICTKHSLTALCEVTSKLAGNSANKCGKTMPIRKTSEKTRSAPLKFLQQR